MEDKSDDDLTENKESLTDLSDSFEDDSILSDVKMKPKYSNKKIDKKINKTIVRTHSKRMIRSYQYDESILKNRKKTPSINLKLFQEKKKKINKSTSKKCDICLSKL